MRHSVFKAFLLCCVAMLGLWGQASAQGFPPCGTSVKAEITGFPSVVCTSTAAFPLTAKPQTPQYAITGPGVTGDPFNGYFFDPAMAGAGVHSLALQGIFFPVDSTKPPCQFSATRTVRVLSGPDVKIEGPEQICFRPGAAVTYAGSPAGGTWSSSVPGLINQNGVVFLANAQPGVYTITYTVQTNNGCPGTATKTITIAQQIEAEIFGLPEVVCLSGIGFFEYPLFGSPEGGQFSGPGVDGNTFFPGAAGVGTHVITYEGVTAGGCPFFAMDTVQVKEVCCPAVQQIGTQVEMTDANTGFVTVFGEMYPEVTTYIVQIRVSGAPNAQWTSYETNALPFTVPNDLPMGQYEARIISVCEGGEAESPVVTFLVGQTTSCPAPLDFIAFGLPGNGIGASWSPVPGAIFYIVEVCYPGGGPGSPITCETFETQDNEFGLDQVPPPGPYTVRVRAVCRNGDLSPWTQPITVTVGGEACPGTEITDILNITATTAQVFWQFVPDAWFYQVRYRIAGSLQWIELGPTVDMPAQLTGLKPGTEYEVQVRVVCSNNSVSTWSEPEDFETREGGRCRPPREVSAEMTSNGDFFVVWEPVDGAFFYTVRYCVVNTQDCIEATVQENQMVLTGLKPNTEYQITVTAFCENGEVSEPSRPIFIKTQGGGDCIAPEWYDVQPFAPTSAWLNWSPVFGASSYVVEVCFIGIVPECETYTAPGQENFLELNNLQPGGEYTVRIRSVCQDAQSPWGQTIQFRMPVEGECQAPAFVSAFQTGPNSAFVEWSPALGAVAYYVRVCYTSVFPEQCGDATLPAETTSFPLDELAAGGYYVEVYSICADSSQAGPAVTQFFIQDEGECQPVREVWFEQTTDNAGNLNWAPAPGAQGYYVKLCYLETNPEECVDGEVPADFTSIPLDSLPAGRFRVEIYTICPDGSRVGPAVTEFFIPSACPTPQELKIFEITQNSANLSWTPVPGAQGYYIQVCPPAVFEEPCLEFYTENTTYVLENLPAGVSWEVNVYTVCGEEQFSLPIKRRFETPGNPDCRVPSRLSITEIMENSAVARWGIVEGALAYLVEICPIESNLPCQSFITGSTTFKFEELMPGMAYRVTVRTICRDSSFSNPSVGEFITPGSQCKAPIDLQVVSEGSGAYAFWSPVPGAQYYVLRYRPINSQQWIVVETEDVGAFIENLQPGVVYLFQIASQCEDGRSPFSPEYRFIMENTDCPAPFGLTVAVEGNTAIVNWSYSQPAAQFVVRYRAVGSSQWQEQFVTDFTVVLEGLLPNTAYVVEVAALCADGRLSAPARAEFRTGGANNCLPVRELFSAGTGTTTGVAEWWPSPNAIAYEVSICAQPVMPPCPSFITTDTKYVFEGLTPGTLYMVFVRAICADSSFSEPIGNELVTEQTRCPAPERIVVDGVTGETANVFWAPVEGAIMYEVSYSADGGITWASVNVMDVANVVLTGLSPNTTYLVMVRAYCDAATPPSEFTFPVEFTTTQPVCNTPAELNVEITDNGALVTWTPTSGAQSYEVQYRVVGAINWETITVTQPNVLLSTLIPNSRYEVRVRAICGPQNASDYTPRKRFRAGVVTCGMPSDLQVLAVYNNATTYEVSWTPAATATGYELQWKSSTMTGWVTIETQTTTVTLPNLKPCSSYEFRVRAKCAFSTVSDYTPVVTLQTPSVCDLTGDIDVEPGVNFATIIWDANPCAVEYQVSFREKKFGSQWSTVTIKDPLLDEWTINNLKPSTEYEFRIRMRCADKVTSPWYNGGFTTLSPRAGDAPAPAAATLTVYPNPARDYTTVSASAEIRNVQVVTLTGQTIRTWNGTATRELQLDLDGAPAGVYLLRVTTADGIATQRIQIQR